MSGYSKLGLFNLIKEFTGGDNQHLRISGRRKTGFYQKAGYYLILGPVKLYVLKYHSWNMMCMDVSNKYRVRTYCFQCSLGISAFCCYVFDVLIFIYNKSNLHKSFTIRCYLKYRFLFK